MSRGPDEPFSLTGTALVKLDSIESPAASAASAGKRVEALTRGEQERCLTA